MTSMAKSDYKEYLDAIDDKNCGLDDEELKKELKNEGKSELKTLEASIRSLEEKYRYGTSNDILGAAFISFNTET